MNATVQALREEQAKKVAANLSDIGEVLAHMDYADCAATYDYSQGVSPTDVRLVFVGPSDRHSLDVLSSDRERVLAHWHGFVEKNGGGWAKIYPIQWDSWCDRCSAELKTGQFAVHANHGRYCSGECAQEDHDEYAEGDDHDEV